MFKSILHNLFGIKTPDFRMNNTVEQFCPDERCMDGVDQSVIYIYLLIESERIASQWGNNSMTIGNDDKYEFLIVFWHLSVWNYFFQINYAIMREW